MEIHEIRGPVFHSYRRVGVMVAWMISAAVASAIGVWAGDGNVAGEGEEPAADIWTKYYDRTADREPRPLLLEALERFREEGRAVERAVDAGCGTGVEALFLARMGAEVRAFDSQPEAIRRLKAQAAQAGGLQVLSEVAPFHEADWGEENDLVFAGYALPFAAPDHFGQAWQKLTASLVRGGRFAGHLFGDRDDWAGLEGRSHHTREQVEALLAGRFEVEVLREIEEDRPTARGTPKHWHVFEVIARKR